MKISTLIEALQKNLEIYGDLDVLISGQDGSSIDIAEGIDIRECSYWKNAEEDFVNREALIIE